MELPPEYMNKDKAGQEMTQFETAALPLTPPHSLYLLYTISHTM